VYSKNNSKDYVIIPTYKEADNLKELLPLLKGYNVIIVDDNSNDGTIEICRGFKNVKLIVRENKRGLSSAVFDGIKSIKEDNANIVVADADFEHDYNSIDKIFKLLKNYDFVECVKIGRRSLKRGLISNMGKLALYTLVPETKWLKDPMSGFFGFRKQSVYLDKVKPIGYKIMLEIFMNLKKGSKKTHLYYRYGYRKYGKSKLSIKVIMEFLEQIMRLNNYRVLIFLSVGVFGIFLNEYLLYLFYSITTILYALIYAITISTVVNFLLNHFITFKSRSEIVGSFIKFVLVTTAGGIINLITAYYLSFIIMYLIANFVGILVAFIFKYSLAESYIWSIKN